MTDHSKNRPTLVVMAAGMGSRYGGLKQIDPVGPNGEIVIDYSIHDAIQAGFGKAVFIIRRDIESSFRDVLGKNIEKRMDVEYAFQDLTDLPPGFSVPEGRTKPWGTAHAIYAARDLVREPFAVINADDLYGTESFHALADQLRRTDPASVDYSMVAYILRNTLSDHGSVTRGVCDIEEGLLRTVHERGKIEPDAGGARYLDGENWFSLTGNELVSMNMWGFTPRLFDQISEGFPRFLTRSGQEAKSEYLIPVVVDDLIRSGQAVVHALRSNAKWLGVTYPEDKATVAAGVQGMIDAGMYPSPLWT
jgi:dTDP-glucose pyrophosphorylase